MPDMAPTYVIMHFCCQSVKSLENKGFSFDTLEGLDVSKADFGIVSSHSWRMIWSSKRRILHIMCQIPDRLTEVSNSVVFNFSADI
jgi:hypothetical protein